MARSESRRNRYHAMRFGPVAMWRDAEGIHGDAATGRSVFVACPHQDRHPHGEAMLGEGVEIFLDGELVARAHQHSSGVLRKHRVVHITGVRPGLVPDGAYLRLRGVVWQAWLQTDDRTLVRPKRPWPMMGARSMWTAGDVSDDLALMYPALVGAVRFAL